MSERWADEETGSIVCSYKKKRKEHSEDFQLRTISSIAHVKKRAPKHCVPCFRDLSALCVLWLTFQ